MKKICVIGYPAKHSLSPSIHKYWLEKYGIEGDYEIREIEYDKSAKNPFEHFDKFFKNLHNEGYIGCNITIPFKERAFELVGNTKANDSIGDFGPSLQAMFIRAVNTILIKKYENQEKYEYLGLNTDVDGFIRNIEPFDFEKGSAVVLGAGGASRAVIFGLIAKNIPEIIISNRSKDRVEKLKEQIENDSFYINILKVKKRLKVIDWESRHEALKNANLLVNTTSLGMAGQPPLEIDLTHLPKDALVTDIVYRSDNKNPLMTNLLLDAEKHGNPIVDGLGMLLYQAKPGFEMWFAEELNELKKKDRNFKGVEVTQELRKKIESLL